MSGLVRGLGFWQATSLVVGTIIGTGVFLKTAVMAQLGGSPLWVLAAWLGAGLLSFAGAMTYAELGAMFPKAGGEYVYLRRGYGPFMGYLFAWNRFWIATPGSIAAYAVGSATFLGGVTALGDHSLHVPLLGEVEAGRAVALAFIATFTALNCMNVRSGGNLQTVLTAMKVAVIVALALGAILAPSGDLAHITGASGAFPGFSAFGAMVLAALWAYDGWNNLPMAAGEVRDPERNVPRAIIGGAIVVFGIYALINLGYFFALPLSEVQTSSSDANPNAPAVAAKVATQFLGESTQIILAAAMMLSALSAMNGSMLTGARVPYAVAKDNLAPRRLADLSERSRVPVIAVLVQGALSCVFTLNARFDELTNAVVFASWLFYALNAGSVLLLRRREPDRPRPFRVPGFPVVPFVFITLSTLLLLNTIYMSPKSSMLGLGTTLVGAIVYVAFLRGRAAPLTD